MTDGIIDFLANGRTDDQHPDEERTMFLAECLTSHVSGDWGDLDAEDRETMRRNLRTGATLMSSFIYHPDDERIKVWVISDSVPPEYTTNRAVTTILLPSEY
jgi:hypothetical protein